MNTPTPKPLAYSYRRFSHVKQEESNSLKRQRDIAVEYCNKHNLQLVEDAEYSFLDKAKSAYHGKNVDDNGELRRFYDLVEAKAIPVGSYLIVESLDRLSRQQPKEALPRFLDLLNAGINVVSINDDRVYTGKVSDLDLIVSIMEMSRAHSESANKSKRVGKAWRDKQELARDERKPLGATKPGWMDAVYRDEDKDNPKKKPTHYVINEAKAEIVRSIFRMAIAGHGREVIARKLNEAGIPSFKGLTWGGSSVAQIIKSSTVIGTYQPMTGKGKARKPVGTAIPRYYDPIIDEDTYHAANGAMSDRFRGRVTKQASWVNVWQKIALCAKCGATLHVASKGIPARKYYQCREARKGECTAKAVRLDRSEEVFKQLLAKVNSLSLVQDNTHTLNAQLQEVDGRITSKQAQIKANLEFLQTRSSDTIRNLIADDEDEKEKLERRRDELLQTLAADTITDKEAFFAKLDLTSPDGRTRANGLLRRLKIVVYFDPAEQSYKVVKDGMLAFVVTDQQTDSPPRFFPADSQSSAIIQRQDKAFRPFWNRTDDATDSENNVDDEGYIVTDEGYTSNGEY